MGGGGWGLDGKKNPLAGVAPAASRLASGRVSVAPREHESGVRYAGAALALSGGRPDVLAVTPIPRKVGNDRPGERGLVVRPSYPVLFAWTCLGAIQLTVCQGLCRCSGADWKSALRLGNGRQSWNGTGLLT